MKRKNCEACRVAIVFLQNPKTGKFVPVDLVSITEHEMAKIVADEDVEYRSDVHVSHYKTCTDPGRFTRHKKSDPTNPK